MTLFFKHGDRLVTATLGPDAHGWPVTVDGARVGRVGRVVQVLPVGTSSLPWSAIRPNGREYAYASLDGAVESLVLAARAAEGSNV